ncbi:MAG TPA: hypothetical protein PKM73_10085 [Verrucomicrobiota bacterium]|nr:hypothetical protein [Verrucomicrobiota bacterium]HNU51708.1 hypothetical protein [Verrucomicrobiota bacterium]
MFGHRLRPDRRVLTDLGRSLGLALGLALLCAAGNPAETPVTPSQPPETPSAPRPRVVTVTLNGHPTLPAPGSTAGVWFYSDPKGGCQLLLTGHATVLDSWRITASLDPGDTIRLTLLDEASSSTQLGFHAETLSSTPLSCRTETNTLVLEAPSEAAAARLTRLTAGGQPVILAPQRRPYSTAPVLPSPDPRPAIAEALVDWDWRMQDGIGTPREPRTYRAAIDRLLPRLDTLVEERRRLNTLKPEDAAAWQTLRAVPLDAAQDDRLEVHWLALHQLRRRILLGDPRFHGQPLLFVKHVPSVMSHQLTQVYGYCARPGGGLFELPEPGVSMRTRELTPPGLHPGNFMTPELSYDAAKVFFAYCPVTEAPGAWDFNERTRHLRYHLYELDLASGTARALTRGDTDNFSPVQLPSGRILFISTRRGGFHRCGRGPCFVYTLARMEADGSNPDSISFHETHEWDPALMNDGRVVYTRWDYVDRNAVHYEHLWSARPDGSNVRIVFGNHTWNPTGLWEARPIPGSDRLMAIAGPHHGMSAGSVVLVDTSQARDGSTPITRLTPDVRFPESESPLAFGPEPAAADFDAPVKHFWQNPLAEPGTERPAGEEERRWPGHCYKSPWPLAETLFVVSYGFDQLRGEPGPNIPNLFGLYLADASGNKELIYRDPAISSLWARPFAPRTPPPELTSLAADSTATTGTFFLSDVTESWPRLPEEIPVTHLRIIQVLLKTTPNADSPRVGAAFAAPGKQVLGTVPVEPDGSAFFEAPARTPMLFQALDARGRAVQTMRSLVYLQPGERESCVGCHEHRMKSEPARTPALALQRPPSTIRPGPEGSKPFSYPRLVQPVLDRHCVGCHDGRQPGRPVLTGEPEGGFTRSYNALVARVSFSAWNRPQNNFEPITEPLRFGALASPLLKTLETGPCHVPLTREEEERLNTWMDANALFYGTFDVAEQARQLAGEAIPGPQE